MDSTETHAPPSQDPPAPEGGSPRLNYSKRRKIRKGTNSCWACKRRKVKCIFASPADVICLNCRRRGSSCIGQEFPEEEVTPGLESVREEVVVARPKSVGGSGERRLNPTSTLHAPSRESLSTPVEVSSPTQDLPYSIPGIPPAANPTSDEELDALSQALHAAFPSQKDADILYSVGQNGSAYYFHQVSLKPQSTLEADGATMVANVARLPEPGTHPVLLARSMLVFVTFLQGLPARSIQGLSEPLETIEKRLAEKAMNFMACHEKVCCAIEGLECIILQAVVQLNTGNLRAAWFSLRKPMNIAQILGFHRPHNTFYPRTIDPNNKINTHFMWFRIVYMDRLLSLLLALPQGTSDGSIASDAALAGDTPVGRLERVHSIIAGRILDRNDHDWLLQDFSVTEGIDLELQKAAKLLPAKFWLPPSFIEGETAKAVFWKSIRVVSQVFHYNLLNSLHLPFLLRFSADSKYDYSKITCATASREILTRFIAFRSFNFIASCCRPLDFFAFTASMTLVLAHLDSHRYPKTKSPLVHQRHSDRGMIEHVLENMDRVSHFSHDALCDKSAELLRCLMRIEAEAAEGRKYHAETIWGAAEHDWPRGGKEDHVLRLAIPTFGVIKIAREGVVCKDDPFPEKDPTEKGNTYDATFGTGSVHGYYRNLTRQIGDSFLTPFEETDFDEDMLLQPSTAKALTAKPASDIEALDAEQLRPSPCTRQPKSSDNGDGPQEYESMPNEGWDFQGVDLAFFDNLMGGTDLFGLGDDGGGMDFGWQGHSDFS